MGVAPAACTWLLASSISCSAFGADTLDSSRLIKVFLGDASDTLLG
jgi:hypothetical protein